MIAHIGSMRIALSLLKLKKEQGISYTVHAPSEDLNIASFNPKLRRLAIDELHRSIQLAAKVDAELWVVHPRLYSGLSWAYPGHQWNLNLEALKDLREKAEGIGLCVGIENMPRGRFLLGSSKDFTNFFAERTMEDAAMTLDVGHANTHDEVGEFLTRLGSRIVHMHIHDNYGSRDEHNLIGRGTTDWLAVSRFLKTRSFSGFLIVESTSETIESYGKAREMLGPDR
jgi:sugar phosphate isomerase/epimerase